MTKQKGNFVLIDRQMNNLRSAVMHRWNGETMTTTLVSYYSFKYWIIIEPISSIIFHRMSVKPIFFLRWCSTGIVSSTQMLPRFSPRIFFSIKSLDKADGLTIRLSSSSSSSSSSAVAFAFFFILISSIQEVLIEQEKNRRRIHRSRKEKDWEWREFFCKSSFSLLTNIHQQRQSFFLLRLILHLVISIFSKMLTFSIVDGKKSEDEAKRRRALARTRRVLVLRRSSRRTRHKGREKRRRKARKRDLMRKEKMWCGLRQKSLFEKQNDERTENREAHWTEEVRKVRQASNAETHTRLLVELCSVLAIKETEIDEEEQREREKKKKTKTKTKKEEQQQNRTEEE